jgi:hypothetical protein
MKYSASRRIIKSIGTNVEKTHIIGSSIKTIVNTIATATAATTTTTPTTTITASAETRSFGDSK